MPRRCAIGRPARNRACWLRMGWRAPRLGRRGRGFKRAQSVIESACGVGRDGSPAFAPGSARPVVRPTDVPRPMVQAHHHRAARRRDTAADDPLPGPTGLPAPGLPGTSATSPVAVLPMRRTYAQATRSGRLPQRRVPQTQTSCQAPAPRHVRINWRFRSARSRRRSHLQSQPVSPSDQARRTVSPTTCCRRRPLPRRHRPQSRRDRDRRHRDRHPCA